MPEPAAATDRPRPERGRLAFFRPLLLVIAASLAAGCASVDGQLEVLGSKDYEDQVEAVVDMTAAYQNESVEHLERRAELLVALGAALQGPSALVRQHAIDGLAVIGGLDAAGLITDRLRDKDKWVRRQAALALGLLEASAARGPLEDALGRDGEPEVRRAAAQALTAIRDDESKKALYLGLGDPDPSVRFACLEGLRAVTGEDHGEDPRDWRSVVR